jgi:hypothetical protein
LLRGYGIIGYRILNMGYGGTSMKMKMKMKEGYGLQTNRFLGVSDGGSVSAAKVPSMANGGSR